MCNPELENVFIELVVKTEIRKEKHRGEGEDREFCQRNWRQRKRKRKNKRWYQGRGGKTDHYGSRDRFHPVAAFLFFWFFYVMYLSRVCPFLSPQLNGLGSSWPTSSLDVTHCPIFRLCWTANLRHTLPALLVCTPAGNGTDWALLFFPPPPLTLFQAFLGVPGHLPDIQSCLHSDKTEWLT